MPYTDCYTHECSIVDIRRYWSRIVKRYQKYTYSNRVVTSGYLPWIGASSLYLPTYINANTPIERASLFHTNTHVRCWYLKYILSYWLPSVGSFCVTIWSSCQQLVARRSCRRSCSSRRRLWRSHRRGGREACTRRHSPARRPAPTGCTLAAASSPAGAPSSLLHLWHLHDNSHQPLLQVRHCSCQVKPASSKRTEVRC